MKRLRRILINIIVLSVLFVLLCYVQNLYLSPLSAHEDSERIMHYGPSKVVHTEDYNNGTLVLSKYDKWVSCSSIPKKFLLLFGSSENFSVFENNKTKAITYETDVSIFIGKVYGIVNDPDIKKIEVILNDGEVMSTTKFYDNLFLFSWNYSRTSSNSLWKLKGYDGNGKVIFDTF